MPYSILIVFTILVGCAGQKAPSSQEKKEDTTVNNPTLEDGDGNIANEDIQLADVPEIDRLEKISQLRLDTSDFAVTGLIASHFTLNDHHILSLSYDLPPEADYVQVLRCRDAVRIEGETLELGQALAIEDKEQRDEAFRNNLFWENALTNCAVLADHFIRKTMLDSFAASGEYYYIARACVHGSRLAIEVEGQTSRNCSRVLAQSSSIIYENERSQDVLEAMEALTWQLNQENTILSDIREKTEQLTRSLLICQKKEEKRIVSYAKAQALASVLAQGIGVFAGLGQLKGSLKELKPISKKSNIPNINGGKDITYSTRTRKFSEGQEVVTKYDGQSLKFSQDRLESLIRGGKMQKNPQGKDQSLSHDDALQSLVNNDGPYTISAIKHVRSNTGATENITVFGKDSKGLDVSITARRSNVDGTEWKMERNLPGEGNQYGVAWGRAKDSKVFNTSNKDDPNSVFEPKSTNFKQDSLLKSLVTGKGGWSDRTGELTSIAVIQSVRQATIMPMVTTETFGAILTKGSHIKTNCVDAEKIENELTVLTSKLDQSYQIRQKIEELADIRINRWRQTQITP